MLSIDPQILTFIMVVGILTMTPGADTMLVIRNVMAGGRLSGIVTILGINLGLFFHASLSALGLSVILVQSAAAYETVKIVGAMYLIFLGLKSIYRLIFQSKQQQGILNPDQSTGEKTLARSFSEGLITNILNPKVAIFYLAFLPQFINRSEPVLLKSLVLAVIHGVLGLVWLGSLSFVLHKGREFIKSTSFKSWLEGTSGVILLGLGLRLFFEKK